MTRITRPLAVGLALLIIVPTAVLAGDPSSASGQSRPPTIEPRSTAEQATSTTPSGAHATFQPGDVFVGANAGKVEWHLPDGTLNKILDTGASASETTGMGFDFSGNLYVTAFQANQIFEFNTHGDLVGPWGSGFNADPESIAFSAGGPAFVGQADGAHNVLRFAPNGQLIDSFPVEIDDRGSDWIDLASDQCTIRYTSEGTDIKQYNVCTRIQLTDWGTLPPRPNTAYAIRIIGDTQSLVADWMDIRLVDSNGATLKTFDAPGEDAWFALNLDPDGVSFWSANYFTGTVYRFSLSTGQVLATMQSSSGQTSGLAVYGEFRSGATRSCASEDLSGAFGRIDPNVANGERVTVLFDGRVLAQQDAVAVALAMAQKVKDRAEATLAEYHDALGLAVPTALTIKIQCSAGFGPIQAPGFTPSANEVQLMSDLIRNELASAARAGFPAGEAWNLPGALWKNTIDHELFHTIQYQATNLADEVGLGNYTEIESPATAAQDLISDVDDIAVTNGSYLQKVQDFAQTLPHPSIQWVRFPNDFDQYRAASILQYWGERYGPQSEPNLEKRVARFLFKLMGAPGSTQEEDFAQTLGYDWSTSTFGSSNLETALRDYYVAHYALRAGNVSAASHPAYAILDAETGHGRSPGQPAPNQATYEKLSTIGRQKTLNPGENSFSFPLSANLTGDVYELAIPPGTAFLDVSLDSSAFGRFSTAIVPVQPNDQFVLDPDLMFSGPAMFVPIHRRVQVVGVDHVAILFVKGSGTIWGGANLDVKATPIQGQPNIQVVSALSQGLRTAAAGPLQFDIQATVDGQAVTGDVPRSTFGVKVGSADAFVASVEPRGGQYHIEAWVPASTGSGTYPLSITFDVQTFPAGSLDIGTSSPERRQQVSSVVTPPLAQSQTDTQTAAITSGASAATFQIAWSGSTFDLTLVSPSGRTITSSSTDSDVSIARTPTSVAITVSAPQSGAWTMRTTGVAVPTPEKVTVAASEDDAPVTGSIWTSAAGSAGLPITIRLPFTTPTGALTSSSATATVTDPSGRARHFTLRDDGASNDANAGDGVFGGTLWATDVSGTYRVQVDATGTFAASPVQRTGSATIVLAAKTDTDGDGVADGAETLLGLDPHNPADGAIDVDSDGLTMAQELAAGTDPARADSDRGGENDQSELAAGREPTLASDDAAVSPPGLGAAPHDGRIVSVTLRTTSGSGSVHLYRTTQATTTDLGLLNGSGATIQDGPLPQGQYGYRAIAVSPTGAQSPPTEFGPVIVGDDVTPPATRITLNQGNWEISALNVPVTFTDLTETPTHMRLALSEAALATATWIPFTPFASITVPPTLGQQFVYAQVRDATGNAGPVASSFVFVVDRTPPTSQAGALPATSSGTSVAVPYTAADDLTGVASVELWARSRVLTTDPWGAWSLATTGSTSPLTYTFTLPAGYFEFYTIAVDGSGNRETAPATADAATQRISASVTTTRVSESTSHGQGNGLSDDSYMSQDARYVTYRSTATNLVTGDTNGVMDAFVHDRLTATTTRVSTTSTGAQGNAQSDDPAFSANGRYVTFRSQASNFVASDTNGSAWDIFVKDLQTGAIERVSVSSAGAQANNRSADPAISADGRYVVFSSLATNLVTGDTNGQEDVFLRDRTAGTTIRISVSSAGVAGNGLSDDPILSDDGRYLVYQSTATNLVTGDTNAVRDIFLYDRVTATTTRVSLDSAGVQANAASNDPAISPDGTRVAFESDATNLVTGDTNAKQDVFLRVIATGVTTRVSVTNAGAQGTGRSSDPSLSIDGTIVAFTSSSASLVTGDTNGKDDIFVRNTVAGTTVRFSISSAGAQSDNLSDNPAIAGDGKTVAFHSDATNLVAADTNNTADVFVRGPGMGPG